MLWYILKRGLKGCIVSLLKLYPQGKFGRLTLKPYGPLSILLFLYWLPAGRRLGLLHEKSHSLKLSLVNHRFLPSFSPKVGPLPLPTQAAQHQTGTKILSPKPMQKCWSILGRWFFSLKSFTWLRSWGIKCKSAPLPPRSAFCPAWLLCFGLFRFRDHFTPPKQSGAV